MLAPPLAVFLRARRADCNARFAAARRHWPRLDAADFSLFLRDQLSPLASALDPTHVHLVLDRAYDLGLQLVAEKLAGPSAVTPAINLLWTEVFPSMAAHIAVAPRRILGSLSNAAHHLVATSDHRAEIWRSRLAALAPRCSTADELLIVAQLLAWRAGLAHFRSAALAAADALPPDLALAVFDAPADLNWPEVRDAYRSDPWFGCDTPATPDRRIGAFRGFGGLFVTPPLVTRSGSHILVRSGDESWILIADSFGATLHRATPDEIADAAPVSPPPRDFGRLPSGHVPASAVILGGTYAVTSGQSHSIWVGPITPER
ncbi:MAG: hypothetical protein V4689_00355 [Verrucomicrobiota bacterium]